MYFFIVLFGEGRARKGMEGNLGANCGLDCIRGERHPWERMPVDDYGGGPRLGAGPQAEP